MGSYLNSWIKFWLSVFGAAILLPLNSPAFAETKSISISINTEENQSFANLIHQAESTVTNSIDQEFNRLPTVTEVEITVIGERNGQEVPLLSTKVSRLEWQAQPKIKLWTNYFTKAGILLGFNSQQKPQSNAPKSSVTFSANKRNLESDPGFRDD